MHSGVILLLFLFLQIQSAGKAMKTEQIQPLIGEQIQLLTVPCFQIDLIRVDQYLDF